MRTESSNTSVAANSNAIGEAMATKSTEPTRHCKSGQEFEIEPVLLVIIPTPFVLITTLGSGRPESGRRVYAQLRRYDLPLVKFTFVRTALSRKLMKLVPVCAFGPVGPLRKLETSFPTTSQPEIMS